MPFDSGVTRLSLLPVILQVSLIPLRLILLPLTFCYCCCLLVFFVACGSIDYGGNLPLMVYYIRDYSLLYCCSVILMLLFINLLSATRYLYAVIHIGGSMPLRAVIDLEVHLRSSLYLFWPSPRRLSCTLQQCICYCSTDPGSDPILLFFSRWLLLLMPSGDWTLVCCRLVGYCPCGSRFCWFTFPVDCPVRFGPCSLITLLLFPAGNLLLLF